ncbi:MAG: hypothetical protein IPJ23_09300 [Ignavibacteriales bacterium]|nr:hypothetical protein [Ignavibacteriales bacterium]
MKKILSLIFLTLIVYLPGCTDDNSVNPGYYNTPVISKTTDALAYSLVADTYTSTAGYNLTFTSDSLAYSLIITNYFSGNGSLRIKDSSGSILYEETLQGNRVNSFVETAPGIPQKFEIDFDHFTGTLNFALAKSNSN